MELQPEPEPEPEPEPPHEGTPLGAADVQQLFDAIVAEPFNFRSPYEIRDTERQRLRELPAAMAQASGASLRRLLESLQHLASGNDHVEHMRNLHYMCEAGIVQALVTLCDQQHRRGGDDALATKALACLSALGRHSMDREALRWLMRLVVRSDSDFTPDHDQAASLLLLVMRQVVEKGGPGTFVDLRDPLPKLRLSNNGSASGSGSGSSTAVDDGGVGAVVPGGVRMGQLDAWPTDGYTVLLWMRLEEPTQAADAPRAVVRYCSTDGTSGWSLHMVNRRLHISFTASTMGSRGKKAMQTVELTHWTMPVGEWLHVGLVHRRHKLRKSTVSLYVNGELQKDASAGASGSATSGAASSSIDDGGISMPYPEVVGPITQCHIGNLKAPGNRWDVPMSFCGQLGPVILCGGEGFDHVAKANLLAELFQQGPDSFLWLDPAGSRCDLTLPEESRRASQLLPLDVRHAFIPQAYLMMDLEESSSSSSSGIESTAELAQIRNSAVVIRASGHDLGDDSSLGSGRIHPPVPLENQKRGLVGRACFLQSSAFKLSLACLGGPRLVIPFFGTYQSERDVSLLFRLLVELFVSDETYRQTMVGCQAFTMIAQLLSQIHLVHLGGKVVDSVRAVSDALPIESVPWADFQLHLIWHFPLWVYTPETFQAKLLELLIHWTSDELGASRFRKLIGVQRILDMIRLCYWDEANLGMRMRMPDERKLPSSVLSIYLAASGRAPRTSGRVNTRPTRPVLAAMRHRLLRIVENIVGSSPSFLEARSLVSFAMECPDPIPVFEVVEVIVRLYTSPATSAQIASHVENLGGVQLCLAGFDRERPVVDAAFMRLLSIILTTAQAKKAKTIDIEALALAATSQIESRPQTEATIDVMIQLLCMQVPDATEATYFDYEAIASGKMRFSRDFLADRPAIRFPALLDCVLRAVTLCEDGVRKRAVLDLTPLIVQDGFCALMNKSGWQQSLVEVACAPRPENTSANNQSVVATITAVANLFRKALLLCFHDDDGHKVWQETLVIIRQAAANDAMCYVIPFQQIIYRGMLVNLQSEIGTATVISEQDVDQIWVNISHFLADEEDWYALGASVGASSVFATEADLLSCDFVDLYSGFLFAVADKFRSAIFCLDLPLLSHGGQTLFDVLLTQMLAAFRHKPSADMLMSIVPLFQLNLPQSSCMTSRRLIFAVVQLMECLQHSLDDDDLQDWKEVLVQAISDVLQKRWNDFVDDSGQAVLGDQAVMMAPPTDVQVDSFCNVVFGEPWKPHLDRMRQLAQETKATGAYRTEERVTRIFGPAAVSALEEQVGKHRIQESSASDKLVNESRSLAKKLDRDETNRVTAELPRIHQRKSAQAHQLLVDLLHELCTGRGAYTPSQSESSVAELVQQQWWEIDPTELNRGSRMRMRMRPDTQHREYRTGPQSAQKQSATGNSLAGEDTWQGMEPQLAEPLASEGVSEGASVELVPAMPSEDFCSTFLREADKHSTFEGLEAAVVHEVDEVWENQRCIFSSGFSHENLLPVERGPWTDARGARQSPKDVWECPEGWEWTTEWMVEHSEKVDEDGWAYAQSFPAPRGWRQSRSRMSLVRRRRWVRLRRREGCTDDLRTVRYSARSSAAPARVSDVELKTVVSEQLGEKGSAPSGGCMDSTEIVELASSLEFDLTMLREALAAFDNDPAQTKGFLQELADKQREGAKVPRRGSIRPEPAALACLDNNSKSTIVGSLTELLHLQRGGSTEEEQQACRQAIKQQFGLDDGQIDESVDYMAHIFGHDPYGRLAQQCSTTTSAASEMSADDEDARQEKDDQGEEWDQQVSNADLSVLQESRDDSQAYNEEVPEIVFGCQWITPTKEVMGSFSLTGQAMYFSPFDLNDEKEQRWPFASLRLMHRRRYLMQHTALEIFLGDGTNAFLDFPLPGDNLKVGELIRAKKPPNLDRKACTFSSEDVARRVRAVSTQWEAGKIDNFNYLAALNTLAGRTYSDLTQYPVMPWILADYSSQVLDLSNPHTFRDLSKPMGALNPERLAKFRQRADSLEDDSVPWFLFGTHYSTKAAALHYLVRLEPFTSMHVSMQSGKFDSPDRMFHSVPMTWHSCTSPDNLSNVKELTPEWYYCPEMFRNEANLALGTRSDGASLGDVILPPWAETPEDFVRIHREALESPHVSKQLHHWVDLVFGYKQHGEEARAANNVFFHLTYEGAISVDPMGLDPIQQEAIKTQLSSFGQTPMQLFEKPHPQRQFIPELPPLQLTPGDGQSFPLASKTDPLPAVVAIGVVSERGEDILYTLHASNELRIVHVPVDTSASTSRKPKKRQQLSVFRQRLPLAGDHGWVIPSPRTATFAHDCRLLLLGCAWDSSLKIFQVPRSTDCTLLLSVVYHRAAISCIGLSEREEVLLLGSRDTNVTLWRLQELTSGGGPSLSSSVGVGRIAKSLARPEFVFSEHSDEVTAVACNVDLDIVASASADATIVLRSLRTGSYIRTIMHDQHRPGGLQVSSQGGGADGDVCDDTSALFSSCSFTELVITAKNGFIISVFEKCYPGGSGVESELLLHSINGRLLHTVCVDSPMSQPLRLNGPAGGGGGALAWAAGRLTELLLCIEGTEIVVRDLHEQPLHDLVRFQAQTMASGVAASAGSVGGSLGVSIALADDGHVYVGLSDGTVLRQTVSGVIPRILRRRAP